jgi:signal transduction histidine kinase
MTTTKLPFFNWSLKKVLDTEQSDFNKAKIKIIYLILLMSLTKAVLVSFLTYNYPSSLQFYRAIGAGVVYILFLKILLIDKNYREFLTHAMLVIGVLLITSISIFSQKTINTINAQFIFTGIISGFYLLNIRWGLFYSSLIITISTGILALKTIGVLPTFESTELPFPINIILIAINFITLVYSTYLYNQAFMNNIKEKECLNEQLKLAAIEANKLAQSKSDFLSTMSHELRTPLNAVIGITDLLLKSKYDNEQEENLNILRFSGISLRTLINNVLDFNKLDVDKLKLEPVAVNLYNLINHIYLGLKTNAKEKNIEFKINIDQDLQSQYIYTDSTRLSQILFNLIGNSIKYTHNGSINIDINILESTDQTIKIKFAVSDTGIGIAEDKLDTIFEPFVQVSDSNIGGTGLGLPIVKRIITLFDSEIKVKSRLGEGSTFSFEINFEKAHNIVNESETLNQYQDLIDKKILIAEDNTVNIFLIRKICQKWKVDYTIVENGLDAYNAVLSNDYDIILMDINMPVMDGYESSKLIRRIADHKKSNIKIIALTATTDETVDKAILEAGINDVVLKPYDTDFLYQKLVHHINF